MIEEITHWLINPHYRIGVALYARLSDCSGFLLDMFNTGPDDYNQAKLRKELADALSRLQQAEQTRKDQYPEVLKDDLKRAKLLMDNRQALKERMRLMHEMGKEAVTIGPLAWEVLAINDKLDVIYGTKRFVDQNGYLPEPQQPATEDPNALTIRRNTVRTYVTKITGQLQREGDVDKRLKLELRLTRFKTELHDLNTRLA